MMIKMKKIELILLQMVASLLVNLRGLQIKLQKFVRAKDRCGEDYFEVDRLQGC